LVLSVANEPEICIKNQIRHKRTGSAETSMLDWVCVRWETLGWNFKDLQQDVHV